MILVGGRIAVIVVIWVERTRWRRTDGPLRCVWLRRKKGTGAAFLDLMQLEHDAIGIWDLSGHFIGGMLGQFGRLFLRLLSDMLAMIVLYCSLSFWLLARSCDDWLAKLWSSAWFIRNPIAGFRFILIFHLLDAHPCNLIIKSKCWLINGEMMWLLQ